MSRIETIGDAVLYLSDCAEILPTLEQADTVITDPPYGIGDAGGKPLGGGYKATRKFGPGLTRDYGDYAWDDEPIDPALMDRVIASGKWAAIFGGNYYALPATPCWLVWDKVNGTTNFADCELIWTNLKKAVRLKRFLWNGCLRENGEKRGDHPTQKPIGIMEWVISHMPAPCETIIDPFMGSGTTGVACMNLSRKFIGIEQHEPYFDIACRRIEQAQKQQRLFA